MTSEEYRSASLDVVYLAACAVNGQVPDAARVRQMDLENLYKAADRHLLTGITAMALESAGVKDAAFTQAKGKAIRKVAAFDVERAAVLERLENAGIWYMPLKGSVLKDLYPRIGMRQMADNDILFDDARTPEVRAIMEDLGFSTDESFGRSVHDHYFKAPVCNFEMHRALFGKSHDERLSAYYQDVKPRLIQNEGSTCGYQFSDEDFYVYMLAHEYKHYTGSGTGLRSVLDTYVYLTQKSSTLDWTYLAEELHKLGIADFEAQNRSLAMHLFGGEALTAPDQDMLDYILSSGTYGTVQNRVKNQVRSYGGGPVGKLRYACSRIVLPMDTVRSAFPQFANHPILLPFLPGYRLYRSLAERRGNVGAELRTLTNSKRDYR